MAFLGSMPHTLTLAARSLSLEANTSFLINKKACTVRYIEFFFQSNFKYSVSKVLQFYTVLVSYEEKSGYSGIPLPPTLSPSLVAAPENMEGLSSCR